MANVLSAVKLKLTNNIQFIEKQVLKQIWLMKEHYLLGSWTPKSEQNLKMSGEYTSHVPSAVEED